jgi:hypothetical protein
MADWWNRPQYCIQPATIALIHRASSASVRLTLRWSRQERISSLIFFWAFLLIAGTNEVGASPGLPPEK